MHTSSGRSRGPGLTFIYNGLFYMNYFLRIGGMTMHFAGVPKYHRHVNSAMRTETGRQLQVQMAAAGQTLKITAW